MPFSHFLCSSAMAFVTTNSLLASADICRPSVSSGSGAAFGANDGAGAGGVKPLSQPSKSCPDFKDGPEQSACCPSQITAGSFFCCTEAHREQLEALLASEARRRFISNHVAELVLASLALLVFVVLLGSFLCRRTRFCPMLHRRKASAGGGGRLSPGGSLDSAEFLGAMRQSHFHHVTQLQHNRRQQHNRLIPRPPAAIAAASNHLQQPQQQRNHQRVQIPPYIQRLREQSVVEQQRKQQAMTTTNNGMPPTDAPPPYEEFVRVPPPPISVEMPTAPMDEVADGEEEQNRLNLEREGQLSQQPPLL